MLFKNFGVFCYQIMWCPALQLLLSKWRQIDSTVITCLALQIYMWFWHNKVAMCRCLSQEQHLSCFSALQSIHSEILILCHFACCPWLIEQTWKELRRYCGLSTWHRSHKMHQLLHDLIPDLAPLGCSPLYILPPLFCLQPPQPITSQWGHYLKSV